MQVNNEQGFPTMKLKTICLSTGSQCTGCTADSQGVLMIAVFHLEEVLKKS